MNFSFDDEQIKRADELLHGKKDPHKYSESLDFLRGIRGDVFMTMIHQDGSTEEKQVHNIVVERASILIARLLIGEALPTGATFQDIYGNNTIEKVRGLTHLAMGLGKPYETYDSGSGKYLAETGDDISAVLNVNGFPQEWDKQNPPGSTIHGGRTLVDGNALWDVSQQDKPVLVNEIGRKKFQRVQYLNEDYTVNAYPTNIIELETEFGELEVVGGLMEMGLFGGTIEPFDRDYIPVSQLEDYGDMLNYRTFKIWNKSSTDRLQIRWRITIPYNDSPMEPAD